jgi:biotin transport system substrate-specific component
LTHRERHREVNLRAHPEDPRRRGPERDPGLLRRTMIILLASAAVTLSASVTTPIPGSSIPQSAQTLTVVVIGVLLGGRDGALALLAYLLAGAAGMPVFADGAAGWSHLVGPTAGYLVGFLMAAALVGLLADRGLLRRPAPALVAMMGGHALILGLGWLRLAWVLGAGEAFRQGVAPFVVGGLLKSVVAAAIVVAVTRLTRKASVA